VMPPHADAVGTWGEEERFRRRLSEVMRGAGLTESATLGFWDPGMSARLGLDPSEPAGQPVAVRNPMGADQAFLRALVFPNLLHSVARNLSVGAAEVALFELAQVSLPPAHPLPRQPQRLAGVVAGPGIEFADCRGIVETLYRELGIELEVKRSGEPFLHPGRAAATAAGFLGELHPLVRERFGLETAVAVFELDVATLRDAAGGVHVHRDVTSYPPLRQDIAVIVDAPVAAGDVVSAARRAGGSDLAAVDVFDVYDGPPIPAGRKSLAMHLVFQAADRTLTDAEADAARTAIVEALREEFAAELRG
jgi:phenylalanyl-tRNA synthetase beta chain